MNTAPTARTEILQGFTIGITADRRASDQATLFERRGAAVLHGPTLSSEYTVSDNALHAATASVIADPPEYVIANTGVGMRAWLEAAASWDLSDALLAALHTTKVVARGAKAAGAVAAVGVQAVFRAESETLEEVAAWITQRLSEPHSITPSSTRIAVQLDGRQDQQQFEALITPALGEIIEISVYRTGRATDIRPAAQMIAAIVERRVDAVTFTSAPAVTQLVTLASELNQAAPMLTAFATDVIASCVGEVCATRARELGIYGAIAPEVGRLGLMAKQLTEALQARVLTAEIGKIRVSQRGKLLVINGDTEHVVVMTPTERAIVRLLIERTNGLVSDDAIRLGWPGPPPAPTAITSTIARLRKSLTATTVEISRVQRRGYRLTERNAPSSL